MFNIIRTEPFPRWAGFDPFRDTEGLPGFPKLRGWMRDLPEEPAAMKIDVTEDEKAFCVKAELPGVKKEDIAVDVEGDQVYITAQVKRETVEKKDEKVLHSERYYGQQFRSFTLGREIDPKNVAARFENGILEVTLPKSGPTVGQRVAIQ